MDPVTIAVITIGLALLGVGFKGLIWLNSRKSSKAISRIEQRLHGRPGDVAPAVPREQKKAKLRARIDKRIVEGRHRAINRFDLVLQNTGGSTAEDIALYLDGEPCDGDKALPHRIAPDGGWKGRLDVHLGKSLPENVRIEWNDESGPGSWESSV